MPPRWSITPFAYGCGSCSLAGYRDTELSGRGDSVDAAAHGGQQPSQIVCHRALSGAVEPIAAAVTILLASVVLPILPYLLAFAAGAMMYVVVEELIPETQEGSHSNMGTVGFAVGFLLMMLLDVVLG